MKSYLIVRSAASTFLLPIVDISDFDCYVRLLLIYKNRTSFWDNSKRLLFQEIDDQSERRGHCDQSEERREVRARI